MKMTEAEPLSRIEREPALLRLPLVRATKGRVFNVMKRRGRR